MKTPEEWIKNYHGLTLSVVQSIQSDAMNRAYEVVNNLPKGSGDRKRALEDAADALAYEVIYLCTPPPTHPPKPPQ